MSTLGLDRQVMQEEGAAFTVNINGHRLNLGVGPPIPATLWLGPIPDIIYPPAPAALVLESTSAGDAGLVVIGYYLDAAWKLRQYIATFPVGYLAGDDVPALDRNTGAVIIDALRTWGMRILAPVVPTGNANVGDVIAWLGVAAVVQDTVTFRSPQTNFSSTGAKTVPVGFMMLIRGLDVEGPNEGPAPGPSRLIVNIETRTNDPNSYAPVAPWVCNAGMQVIVSRPTGVSRMYPSPVIIGPTRDIRLTGSLDGPNTNFGAANVLATLVPDTLFGTKRTASADASVGDGIPTRGSIV